MPKRSASQILSAKREIVKLLAKEPGFIGAGVTADEGGRPALVVFVERRQSAVTSRIPETWKGFTVSIEVSGRPKKLRRKPS